MEDQLIEELEDGVVDDVVRGVAETLRIATISELEDEEQGADGLTDYISDLEEYRDGHGFSIDHPTALLHERGGHIEPTYAHAASLGWSRDGFYEALEDCNEWVDEKRYFRSAVEETRRVYR